MHDPPDDTFTNRRPDALGVIVVDHGSRAEASNAMLLEIVADFQQLSRNSVVEPGHMELAEPSIAAAFDRCVQRGATFVVVFPYFLLPGRHSQDDIPRLAAEAAARHPHIRFRVAEPFGRHAKMLEIMGDRIDEVLSTWY